MKMNIKGKIVTLRAIEKNDLSRLHDFANDYETQAGIGELHFPSSMTFHEKWFETIDGNANNIRLAIDVPEYGIVGITSLVNIDLRNRRAWHGIMIGDARCRGKGIGLDTVMATMKYAFDELNLNRLDGSMLETNHASISLYCEKLGWTKEGARRAYYYRNGTYFDQVVVGVLKEDYYKTVAKLGYWNE
jgi:RimJ/RimL family protein N-acetyltransferase